MENPVVKVEHLYHRYSTQWAIEDINLEIEGAGVVGLLGSNGAGKSTTMNIICGVLKQTKGKVYINGVDTLKNPEVARGYIGFLPQKPPLYPDLTVNATTFFHSFNSGLNAFTLHPVDFRTKV